MGFANATMVASLYAKIGADTREFDRAMRGADSALGKAGATLGTFAKVGVGAAIAGIGAVAAGFYDATKTGMQFGKTMSGAQAVLQATGEEARQLTDLAMRLGKETKFSASEAAGAIEMLGQNGLTASQIMGGAAQATVDLAAAAGTDLTTAADVASTAMTLFGIKAENMGQAINGISGVTNASRFAIGDYALALAAGGSIASQLGVTFDNFNAVIAATASSFSGGSDAGTSFKTFLQRLVPVSEPAVDAMKQLGLITADGANQFFDAAGKLKSFDQIAAILQGSLSGLSDQMKTDLLFQAFGTDAARMAAALGKIGAQGITAAQGIIQSTSAAEQARIRMDNLAGDVEQAAGSWDTFKITIQKAFDPLQRKAVQAFTGLLNRLIEMDFSPVVKRVEAIVSAFRAAFAGSGNLFERLGKLNTLDAADTLIELSSIFADWAGGIWKLVKPLLLRFWSSIEQWVTDPVRRSKILAAINRTWSGFVNWAKGLWGGIRPALNAMWQSLLAWSTDPMKTTRLSGNALALVEGLWRWARGLWDIVRPDLDALWTSLTTWIGDSVKSGALLQGAIALFSGLWDWAKDIWNGTEGNEGLSVKLGRLWTNITSWVADAGKREQLFAAIGRTWTGFWDWAGSVWNQVSPALGTLWTNLTSWVTDPGKRAQLWENIKSAWTSFWEWAGNIWDSVSPKLLEMWNSLSSWVTDPAKRSQLLTTLGNAWTSFWEWAGTVWGKIWPILSAAWTSLTSWVTQPEKRTQLFDAVSRAWTSFTDWAGKVWEWAAPKLAQFWTDITSWVSDPTKRSQLLTMLGKAWTSFTDWAETIWNGTPENPGGLKGKLGTLWQFLTGWITDPEKRSLMLTNIRNMWTGFTTWAGEIWNGTPESPGGIKAKLDTMFGNINKWLDENLPQLKPWKDAFIGFATGSAKQFAISFPEMAQTISDLRLTLETEIPLIGAAFARLWASIFGGPNDPEEAGSSFVSKLMTFVNLVTHTLGTMIQQFRIFTEIVAISIEMYKAFFSGDFGTAMARQAEGLAKWQEFGQVTGAQWEFFKQQTGLFGGGSMDFGNPPTTTAPTGGGTSSSRPSVPPGGWTSNFTDASGNPFQTIYDASGIPIWTGPAFAQGGLMARSGMALVGEQGPELVNLPGGSYVHDADSTAAMMGGSEHHIVLDVRGESNLPMDRAKLRELARALMGELQLRGMRVVTN